MTWAKFLALVSNGLLERLGSYIICCYNFEHAKTGKTTEIVKKTAFNTACAQKVTKSSCSIASSEELMAGRSLSLIL